MPRSKTSQFILAPKDAYRLFQITTDLADTLENLMEMHGAYSKEFLKGLRLSSKQAQKRLVRKIQSLRQVK